MSQKIRRIIFYSLVSIFILVTPPTILYSSGYSFDWQNHRFVQNGGFYLKSTPNGAKIILDGQDSGTTARLISSITPKIYNVAITKDGYYTWQKKLEVLPGLVTEARNIFLFPQTVQPELIIANATSSPEDFLMTNQEKQNQLKAARIASTTSGWLLQNDTVYYVSGINFILYRKGLNDASGNQLSKDALPAGQYRLFTNNGSRFAVISANGQLYFFDRNEDSFKIIGQNVNGAQMASDNQKFLFWNDNEIWVYYIDDYLIQPNKTAGEKELITRYGQKISQAIFYPDNEHITFVVGNQIKIIELDGRDQRNAVDFLTAPQPQIYFDKQNNYLYYLAENKILRIQLE